MNLTSVMLSAGSIGLCVFLLWLVSVRIKDVSIADIWWAPGFGVIAVSAGYGHDADSLRYGLTTGIVVLWGVRLAAHLARRNLGHEEDRRYQAMRDATPGFWWVSLFKVFFLQGALQLIVALPLYVIGTSTMPWTWLDGVGIGMAAAGVLTEAAADWQLMRFKADPKNAGQVMDRGLWGWSRHPNYFGNALIWLGVWMIGLAAGGSWWIFIGPALMWFLLLRVSGVVMLESTIVERRPDYQRYMEQVSSFFPRPPRR